MKTEASAREGPGPFPGDFAIPGSSFGLQIQPEHSCSGFSYFQVLLFSGAP